MDVVVVDDHHDVLPYIHKAIRQKKLPFSHFSVLHFDAHPDLSFSHAADLVFQPFDLYDALDQSEAGIAEFLIPLLYAGHVNKLIWIKPPWAKQFPCGRENFLIGKCPQSGKVAVTCRTSYFVEEQLFSACQMTNIKDVELLIEELPMCHEDLQIDQPLVLDICLDYFSTGNPFLSEFNLQCGSNWTNLLRRVFYSELEHKVQSGVLDDNQICSSKTFKRVMDDIFKNKLYQHNDSQFLLEVSDILPLYGGTSGEYLMREFQKMLLDMTAEQRDLVLWAGPCVDLPDHISSSVEIEQMLLNMKNFLSSPGIPEPAYITIAKSSEDEYTPSAQVEEILELVIDLLKDIYSDIGLSIIEHQGLE